MKVMLLEVNKPIDHNPGNPPVSLINARDPYKGWREFHFTGRFTSDGWPIYSEKVAHA
jgi:hypothetical protein